MFLLRLSSNSTISVDDPIPLEPEPGATAESLVVSFKFSCHYPLPELLGNFMTTHTNVALLCLTVILLARYLGSPWRSVPPSPRGFPIIENVLEVRDKAWLFMEDCQKRYSKLSFPTCVGLTIVMF